MKFQDEFDAGTARDPEALAGEYAVHLVAAFLPVPVRFFGHRKVFTRSGGGVGGHNAFFGGRLKLGRFRVERGASEDGTDVTKIRYDEPVNPALIRLLTDEVRETAPGRFLGRGMMRIAGKTRNVFWFTVTKA